METEARLFGFSVEKWPKSVIMVVAAAGVFATFLLHGIAHEKLCRQYAFSESLFLTFAQFTGYAALALPTLIGNVRTGMKELHAPMRIYVLTAFGLIMSMTLANIAAVRLSYATKVLFKSSKLIPVMIGNVLFLKKKPKDAEILSVILIVLGLVGISLGDFKGKNRFDVLGLVAVILSLCFDALASNMEDKVMNVFGASQNELISMIYSMGAVTVGAAALVTGEMTGGIQRCVAEPMSVVWILAFAFLGALGIQFVYLIMKVFGSLIAVMTTSVRKAMTVCLSFVAFKDKRLTSWHVVSIMLLTTGMGLSIAGRQSKTEEPSLDNMVDVEFEDCRERKR